MSWSSWQTEGSDLETLSRAIDTANLGLWDYGRAAIIMVVAVALSRTVRFAVRRVATQAGNGGFVGELVGRIGGYLIVAFGFIYALESLGIAVTPVLGALGIVGFALAFALQDILENFVAGIILQIRRPFNPGDEIRSGDFEGSVLEVDARTVTIRTPDGETVRLPSAEVIKRPIVNHAKFGRRRTTIDVGVAYDTDLDLATAVAVGAAAAVEGVLTSPAPEAHVCEFGASSIDLELRYWHEPSIASQARVRDQVARSVARSFAAEQIEIPFPQRVMHSVPRPNPDVGRGAVANGTNGSR